MGGGGEREEKVRKETIDKKEEDWKKRKENMRNFWFGNSWKTIVERESVMREVSGRQRPKKEVSKEDVYRNGIAAFISPLGSTTFKRHYVGTSFEVASPL